MYYFIHLNVLLVTNTLSLRLLIRKAELVAQGDIADEFSKLRILA